MTKDDIHKHAFTEERFNVYFIQDRDNGEIKIGCSEDPMRRIAELECEIERNDTSQQTAPKHVELDRPKLRFIAILPSGDGIEGQKLERKFHAAFIHHRFHGEWFAPETTSHLVSVIAIWCRKQIAEPTPTPWRAHAYQILWAWAAGGFFTHGQQVKLDAKITWKGQRCEGDGVVEDMTGAKLLVTDKAVVEFGERIRCPCSHRATARAKAAEKAANLTKQVVYQKKKPGDVIALDVDPDSLRKCGLLGREIYLSDCFLFVEVVGVVYDMPDAIIVRFVGEESSAYPRKCKIVDALAFEEIITRLAAAEGEQAISDVARARANAFIKAWDTLHSRWGGPP